MKLRVLRIVILAAMVVCTLGVMALDLPVKTVQGRQYYYYKVKKNESLYGIARHLGVSVEEIKHHNPGAWEGVKKNDLLVFPYEEYNTHTPVETAVADNVIAVDSVESSEPAAVAQPRNTSVAVVLPFGSESASPSRRNTLWLDFYKGMLIAADSIGSRTNVRTGIVARDVEGMSAAAVAELCASDPEVSSAAIIIAPDDEATLAAIAAGASERGTYVLNLLAIRDTSYLHTPFMLQANIQQKEMYATAAEALLRRFDGFTPVFLRSAAGKNEKESFVELLDERFRSRGITPVTIEYKSSLLMADLETLPRKNGEKYIFIPLSGSLQEFNKFAYVLKSYRDRLRAIDDDDDDFLSADAIRPQAELFGYPDWTAFRGDALDTLHRLGATVYSRFFDDFSTYGARDIDDAFRRWFGSPYIESIPTYGLLGFDTAMYIIENFRANDGAFDPSFPRMYRGVQSTFEFRHAGMGYVNDALYIITYLPGGQVSASVL